MSNLIDKLVQRRVEGRPDLKVIGLKFALRNAASSPIPKRTEP